MTKARDLGNLLGGGGAGVPSFSGTGAIDVPAGTTAQRPENPNTGYVRFNTTLDQLEQYTDESGWQGISPPPILTSVSPTSFNGEAGASFTLNGSNFSAGSLVKFITSNGQEFSAATVVRNSGSQLVATTANNFTVADEPLSVKVVSGSGLAAILEGQIDCGGVPTWNTTAGALPGVYHYGRDVSLQLSATDPDGGSVTYAVSSGSLPAGLSLSSSGLISGTANSVGSDTLSSFTVTASDGAGNTSSRSFTMTVYSEKVVAFSSAGASTFSIPSGVSKIRAKMWGAGGGSYYDGSPNNGQGGGGGFTDTTFSVVSGETSLTVVVGGGGGPNSDGGYGGAGGGTNGGSGGGGMSLVASGAISNPFVFGKPDGYGNNDSVPQTNILNADIIAISGGGGGGGWYTTNNQHGGSGGGISGGTGLGYSSASGGTQTSGGNGGSYSTSGSYLLGGSVSNNFSSGGSGGGGGGYYGGGCWQGSSGQNAGGGGGSGFIGFADGSTSTVLTANQGDGASYIDTTTRTNGSRTYTNSQTLRNGSASRVPAGTGDADYTGSVGYGAAIGSNATGQPGRVVLRY